MASDPNPSAPPSLQAMLARLKTTTPAEKPEPADSGKSAEAVAVAPPPAPPPEPEAPAPAAPAAPQVCAVCGAARKGDDEYCGDCGCFFSSTPADAGGNSSSMPPSFVKNRYDLTEMLTERAGVSRFRASDRGAGALQP